MMKRILIIAEYPTQDNIKDGMIQRIAAIDNELKEYDRVYLCLGAYNYEEKIINGVKVYYANRKLHYFKVRRILKDKFNAIYFHSILNFRKLSFHNFYHIPIRILDFHGAVPEEYDFQGGSKSGKYKWEFIERWAVKVCHKFVVVSNNMSKYYQNKHSIPQQNIILKPIVPKELHSIQPNTSYDIVIPQRYKGKPIILYSGNFQKWQNLDKMLDFIEKFQNKYYYIFLTGQATVLKKNLENRHYIHDNIMITSVAPDQLSKYYSIANYGFLLRDEHPLNYVAAPTKLIEYLIHGMIPILLYSEIGDQSYYHYDFVNFNDALHCELAPVKSNKNRMIGRMIIKIANENNVKNIIND